MEINIKDASLQNVLTSLRKKGIVENNQIVSTYIPKIEKAHNIKAYYMMPLKDLLLKFEQIMRASDKMYSDYDKKL